MVGVSRPILRTALARLKTEGMIVSRQGAGSFVRDRATTTLGFSPVETIADIQRCYEFRLTIERMPPSPLQTAVTDVTPQDGIGSNC
jgi:GntR family transcriptional repressor for pyruvate dehydrogenase complex